MLTRCNKSGLLSSRDFGTVLYMNECCMLNVFVASVVNKDLSFKTKAKAKDLTAEHVQGPL